MIHQLNANNVRRVSTYDDGGVLGKFTGNFCLGNLEGVERLEFFSTSSKNDHRALRKNPIKKQNKKLIVFKNIIRKNRMKKKKKKKIIIVNDFQVILTLNSTKALVLMFDVYYYL
jgi:hypothetical protein